MGRYGNPTLDASRITASDGVNAATRGAARVSVMDLRADGQLVWRLEEPMVADPARGIRVVDLLPPCIDAVYGSTWRRVVPGEIEVEFAT